MAGLIGKPKFAMWPLSHILALFEVSKAHKEGRDTRPKFQKAAHHGFTLFALLNAFISMIPIFSIAYFTNKVFPVLEIIEEAKDKERFYWMLKVWGRDMVT
jgi:hypothetical protein